jgi:hypothetical protein
VTCNCTKFSEALKSFADVRTRCEHSDEIQPTLEVVAKDISYSSAVLRCRVCGTLWVQEYPFPEMQGGGISCLYRITTSDPAQWLASACSLTMRLRSEFEDRSFFGCLGEEVGPEFCRHSGCTHKRIQVSVMCRLHHFEMIRGRPYLYATNEA